MFVGDGKVEREVITSHLIQELLVQRVGGLISLDFDKRR